jgi:hypothetical protein
VGWSFALAGVGDPGTPSVSGLKALSGVGLQHQSSFGAWRFASGRLRPGWKYEPLASRLARDTGHAALLAWVFDSDTGYLAIAEPGGEPSAWLAIGEAVSEYDDENADPRIGEIRRHNAQWNSAESREAAAEALASWSERWAPEPITVAAVINSWRDDDEPGEGRVFIEDAVREIFAGMGLPSPDLITG